MIKVLRFLVKIFHLLSYDTLHTNEQLGMS